MAFSLKDLHHQLSSCKACLGMCGTPVHGPITPGQIMLIGQAPGPHEAKYGRPFAYTAGKTLFKWLEDSLNLSEEQVRHFIYFSAVVRCFPGKNLNSGGDRVPDQIEIQACRGYLESEIQILRPKLILAVGKLAISEVLGRDIFPKNSPLDLVIGKDFFISYHGHPVHVIPLPHPSGISTWHKKEPGKTLLKEALKIISQRINSLTDQS